jgi:MFS family permease
MNNKLDQFRDDEDSTGRPRFSGSIISFSFKKTFVSFQNPIYRLYYFSMVGHWSSMNMQMFARNLLVWYITGSGAILGILALSHAIPMIIFTLPGGVLADRMQKKNVIQVCQVASVLISLGTTLALVFGYLSPAHPESWWVLAVSGILQGLVMGMMTPSRAAIVSEIVKPNHLMNAISLNNLGMNVFRIISPALAGFLVDVFDFWVVYAIMTFMIVTSVFFIFLVPPTSAPEKNMNVGNSLQEVVEGWQYIKGQKTIFAVLIFTAIGMILGAPYSQLLPMFADKEILNISATGLGLLMMVSGIGAILGSLVLASLSSRKRGLILIIAVMMMALTLIGFSFSMWLSVSMIFIFFIGMGSTVQMALGNSLIQYYVDASYRGRVLSFFMLCFGLSSLGSFFAGILAESIGVQWAVASLAVLLVLFTLLMITISPRLRKLD